MRTLTLAIIAAAAMTAANIARAQDAVPPGLAYPGAIALSKGAAGEWIFRKFPSLMPLYTYSDDAANSGKSMCNDGCSGPWPPVRAEDGDKPVGNWTIIEREDGRRQWVYKGKPVYMRYHDEIGNPIGDGEDGKWSLMKP